MERAYHSAGKKLFRMTKTNMMIVGILALGLSACTLPQASSSLRAPAYPLVTIDPYTSAWSMADNLYDVPVKHWTEADFPLLGAVKVDGRVYRFLGKESIEVLPLLPSAVETPWTGRYTFDKPAYGWEKPGFNDRTWAEGMAGFGYLEPEMTATAWETEDIWVRRTFSLDSDLKGEEIYLDYSNDDIASFYVNGVQVFYTGTACHKNAMVKLPDEAVATLRKGENLIAACCKNTGGNAILDFGLKLRKKEYSALENSAVQTSAMVLPMNTIYTFTCGPVDLKVTFTAPMFMDDLDLLSRPVNYISYEISSNDNAEHDAEVYFEMSPRWALNLPYQPSESELIRENGLVMLKSGSKTQKILGSKGDHIRIDWGYAYLAAEENGTIASIGEGRDLRNAFGKGSFTTSSLKGEGADGQMAVVRRLGKVKEAEGMVMVAYDDIYSIQYFGQNLRPYWNRTGDKTISGQIALARDEYASLMKKSAEFDARLMKETAAKGGVKYSELCALAYRQAIAAHKLVQAPDGDILWLSKENDSNGSIGTVDVTYPSAPIFLYYNPLLAEGLMNHIYDYSETGRWTKPFPAHDVGTYPIANGQTYGGDMPVEEAGNMLTLTAAVCKAEGSAEYARKHWDVLTTWTEYLVQFGLDPENQLCTDDFAGHFAHNTNLSIKAILGIASYAYMADMLGQKEVADRYTSMARDMASQWVEMASDGDHYRLTFDKPGTWSQKYNLVWDRLLGLDIFDKSVAETEIAWYLKNQNRYGLPLDSRMAYTKNDWILWTATMAQSQEVFEALISPVYDFMNETIDRVPMSDWTWTDKPERRGFKTRSVVGAYFIKML